MAKVYGLIGPIASGKSIVADYLITKKCASYYRFSDVLRDLLLRLHKENTRENLQGLGVALRQVFGDDILSETIKRDIVCDDSEIIVVDGIRYPEELSLVKNLGGEIIYITAPDESRYKRVLARATRGEAGISLDEFRENEQRPTERMISQLGEKADHRIDNDGTVDQLIERLVSIVG